MPSITRLLLLCVSSYASGPYAEATAPNTGAGTPAAQPQWLDEKHQRDFDSRVESIEALVGALRSAAADAGRTDRVAVIERDVAKHLTTARRQYVGGDHAAGRKTLDQAYAMAKAALVEVRDGETLVNTRRTGDQYQVKSGQPRAQRNYQERADSIEVLMAAYRRVAQEKGETGRAARVDDQVAAIVARADRHYQAGDYGAALPLLNDAYVVVKESLAALRDGETLVRSLNFASKEEEYQYYVAKTGSQMTALGILRAHGDPARTARLDDLLAAARSSLDQAGVLAAQNRHEEAVPIMDDVLSRLQSGLMSFFSAR